MSRRAGNPKWGDKGHNWLNEPISPTEFELLLKKLSLTQDQAQHSQKVREWAHRWSRSKYIPEALLEHWGIHTD